MDSRLKSLYKTVSWRMLGTGCTFIIAYIFTRDLDTSAIIMIVDGFIKMIAYYIHERLWNGLE